MVSLGGMALYFLMLARGTAARTTANSFYLVPGTAAVLAWLLLGERLSPIAVAGLIVASAGCWLVSSLPAVTRTAAVGPRSDDEGKATRDTERITLLVPSSFRSSPWKNGGGSR